MSDYPEDAELQRVEQWSFAKAPHEDFVAFMAYVKSIGNYWPDDVCWKQRGRCAAHPAAGLDCGQRLKHSMQPTFRGLQKH